MAKLRITAGPDAGQSWDVDRELVIGRENADVTIADEEMSRRHAAIRPVRGGVAIRDLGSLNGTFVNGERITAEVVVTASGRLSVGASEIAFEVSAPGATVVSPQLAAAREAGVTAPGPPHQPTAVPPQVPAMPAQVPAMPAQVPAMPAQPPPAFGTAPPAGRPPVPPPRYGRAPGPGGRRRPPKIVMLIRRRPLVPLSGLVLLAAIVVAVVLLTQGSGKSNDAPPLSKIYPAGTIFNDGVPGIVDKPIAFTVINHNATQIPCAPTTPDGKRYVLYGSLVAPASALAVRPRPVDILISGIIISGDRLWRMRPAGSTSYDDALYLAERGQAVVTVNLLGYHDSVTASGPNGNQVCAAAESTIIHEIVQALRAGNYRYAFASHGPSFDRVAITAFSIGGEYTTAEAYSFRDVDGLVIVGDSPPKQLLPLAAALQGSGYPACKKQNQHKYLNGTGPPGYSMFSTAIAQKVLFYGPDATAVDHTGLAQGAETSPCGILTSGLNELKADQQGLPTIAVPILFAFGQHDGLVGTVGAQFEIKHVLTGSQDRTMMLVPGAGHAWFVERNAKPYLDKVAGWLVARGL